VCYLSSEFECPSDYVGLDFCFLYVSRRTPYDKYTGGRYHEYSFPPTYNGPRQQTLYFPKQRIATQTVGMFINAPCGVDVPVNTFRYVVYNGDLLVKNVTGQGCPGWSFDYYDY
jgi:hypothetical protein